jgi:hypothetical protein
MKNVNFKRRKIVITKEQAEEYLNNKMKELELDTIEELEDFAHYTDDFELASEINMYIMAIL